MKEIMLKNLILSFSLFLTACGGFEAIGPVTIAPEFMPYFLQYRIDKFNYTGSQSIRRINIIFSKLEDYSAVCLFKNKGEETIEVDPEVWFKSTDTFKTILIYHELGHCDLNLEHTTENFIMNPYLIDDILFNTNRNYYLTMLFKEGK